MNVQIAELVTSDIEAVGALARTVWQATYPGLISQAQIDFMLAQRYAPGHLREELARADIGWDKALVDGRLAGFASTHWGEHEAAEEAKLDKLYIDPAAQRRGLGGRLIERAGERARAAGRRTLILAVNKGNAQAIAAYARHGFVKRDAVRVDIGDGFVMDDFIMAKSLF